ncbi:zinc-dependent peptidase [Algoriphagus aquimarinus]|mgnify:CR=1 FL=1|uniref:Zinc-dependent peptidase n=1 Tax=Algoriphagus aquimarinus TaxID=237018 RepID=A0A5C7AG73_9BACT|nr:zinc-dependent peptidase [Algoriphagus aquimarinus]TXE02532.1 zinc-dependent peptidase [Algoriphagus aquimarinus]|tara:strand:- start:196 stop:960 length:765 start_codon:yes stop_codon:yes gene_type:complete
MLLLHSLLLEIFEWLYDGVTYLNRRKITSSERTILENTFPYYQRLNQKHKNEFVKKLELVLTGKSFIGRSDIRVITPEMKVLIGATIVMVTFGWDDLRLPHFSKILIYPDSYYSTISKQYHRGEVNPRHGIIAMSWNCFLNGMENESDGVNLGIHEVAHALKLENQIYYNGESEFFNPEIYDDFKIMANEEIEKIKAGNLTVFRSSAGFNEDEFFAVALETFFEKPHKFFEYNPVLYGTLVRLMRQDPRVWIRQ